ncbi:MAG TPA: YfhO family protein [Anaerolineae bacterium]|nr:YfhO family protein [Anaerolineae bacterium]
MTAWLRKKVWHWRGELAVVTLSSAWVLLLTYPLIARLDSSMYATGWNTDNPGGGWVVGVWSMWWTKQAWAAGLDWRVVPIIGAPFGVDWQAAPFQYVSVYVTTALAVLIGELPALNVLILLSFPLSALTAYWLSFELTHSRRAALVGGLIYAFSTYHWARASVHFNMAMIQWVPLYLLALLRWGRQPTLKRAVVLGAAFALVLLDNYYYGYFMLFVTAASLIGWAAWALVVERTWRLSRQRVMSSLIALASASVIVLPFVSPFLAGMAETRSAQAASPWIHARQDVEAYSAQPWMYLVPAAHPAWRPLLADFTRQHFTLNEQALYLGLAALGLVAWGWTRPGGAASRLLERDKIALATVLVVMLWTSSPPLIPLGPLKLPTPSYFLAEALPMFRAYTRIGGLATVAVSALAAVGVSQVLERWPQRRNWITLLTSAAVLFDFLNVPPARSLDLSQIPAEYEWLAAQAGDFIAIEYPLYPGDAYARMARYLFYQRIHNKRLFNGALPDTQADELRKQIVDVTDPGVPAVLRELGIRYVLIHTDLYRPAAGPDAADSPPPDLSKLPANLRLAAQFGPTRVYEVLPEMPSPPGVPAGPRYYGGAFSRSALT